MVSGGFRGFYGFHGTPLFIWNPQAIFFLFKAYIVNVQHDVLTIMPSVFAHQGDAPPSHVFGMLHRQSGTPLETPGSAIDTE